jgi:hypothetical protein
MEGQFFFTAIAGLSLSLAGFASLIAWLRDDSGTWDPINLWRVQNIVREALTIVFLAMVLIPIFSMTNDIRVTTRFGSVGLVLGILIGVLGNRHPDPAIWVPRISWTIYMTGGAIYGALQLVNIWLASLGILQLGFLLELFGPAGIFYNFVRELGRRREPENGVGEGRG